MLERTGFGSGNASTKEGLAENCDDRKHFNNADGGTQGKKYEGGCEEDSNPPQ